MTALRVLSTLAVMGAMPALSAAYQIETGVALDVDFAPTVALLERLRAGAEADIAILTASGIDGLIGEGLIRPGTRTDVALSFIGVAVRAGEPKPDISSAEAFRATLLAARCVAYSRIGASGLYFADLIRRLGIEHQVNSKAIIVASGFTAEQVVSGAADLAVQQVSELLVVPGIDVVGKLPPKIQTVATFSAGLLAGSVQPDAAAGLLLFLRSRAIAPILRRHGLEPSAIG
jgi:molybdate transport system substrate-binding protein